MSDNGNVAVGDTEAAGRAFCRTVVETIHAKTRERGGSASMSGSEYYMYPPAIEAFDQAIEAALSTRPAQEPVWSGNIEEAPHASTVLASYFDGEIGEWIVELFVAVRPAAPFTHWMHVTRPDEPPQVSAAPQPAHGTSATERVPSEKLRGPTLAETDAANAEAGAEAISAILDGTAGQGVEVKPLEWFEHPNAFPAPTWSAQTGFGFYNIEEVSASDSPAYEVRLHAHRLVSVNDSLDDAKAAAQADYERRILSALKDSP